MRERNDVRRTSGDLGGGFRLEGAHPPEAGCSQACRERLPGVPDGSAPWRTAQACGLPSGPPSYVGLHSPVQPPVHEPASKPWSQTTGGRPASQEGTAVASWHHHLEQSDTVKGRCVYSGSWSGGEERALWENCLAKWAGPTRWAHKGTA